MSRLLHLVRHGESTWNLEHRVQGAQHHPPLTELGRSQARAAATALANPSTGRVSMLLTSDQVRAVQTAEIISAAVGLRPVATPLLREQSWGSLEGMTTSAALAALTGADLMDPDFRWAGGGESTNDVLARVTELLESAMISGCAGADIILVSHGDTIRVLLMHLLGEDPSATPWRQIENGSVTTVSVSEHRGTVVTSMPARG